MTPLQRRLRRLAVLVPALAVAAAVFGMLPDGVDVFHHSWKHDTDTYVGTTHAGGWALVGWAIVVLVAARFVHRDPTRVAGVRWIVVTVIIDVLACVAWAIENFTLEPETARWPGHVTAVCTGASSLLVFVVVPVVLIASKRTAPSDAVTARVVDRQRDQ